jgi:hypothetical protein
VRPVAEFFYEDEINAARTVSGLLGAIWQVNDKLSFDVGLREALTNGHPVSEIRAGFTIGFALPHLSGAGPRQWPTSQSAFGNGCQAIEIAGAHFSPIFQMRIGIIG